MEKTGFYVQNKKEKERNRKQAAEDKGVGVYLYAHDANIAKIPTRAYHISINPNLVSPHFLVSINIGNRVVNSFRCS